ncbi:MAG: hypothetical protein IT384_17725 [Deltaproteobacteria bacterium]|nr:hypothetical protein [Deltaproteobacteria bacterium]
MQDLTVEASPREVLEERGGTFAAVVLPSLLVGVATAMGGPLPWVVAEVGLTGALTVMLLAHGIVLLGCLSLASIASNMRPQARLLHLALGRGLGAWLGGGLGVALLLALVAWVLGRASNLATLLLALWPSVPTPFESGEETARVAVALVVLGGGALSALGNRALTRLAGLGLAVGVAALAAWVAAGGTAVPSSGRPPAHVPISLPLAFSAYFPSAAGLVIAAGISVESRALRRSIGGASTLGVLLAFAIQALVAAVLGGDVALGLLSGPDRGASRLAIVGPAVTLLLAVALGVRAAAHLVRALARDGVLPRVVGGGHLEVPRRAIAAIGLVSVAGVFLLPPQRLETWTTILLLGCFASCGAASAFERWSDPEWRPRFALPGSVGLTGALLAGGVLFLLAPAATVAGAAVGVALIAGRTLIRRGHLGGDELAEGFWSALVRVSLRRLQGDRGTSRHFRPNMLIIDPEARRPELVDLGRAIVGSRGLLTHYLLVEGGPKKALVDEKLEERGLFARVKGTDDAYAEIPSLVSSFGVSGLEANTVLLSWPRDERNVSRFVEMYGRLADLDVNVLLLRHDAARDFGRREQIDIWWDGREHAGQLMLTLAHLLRSSPSWKSARVRLLVTAEPDWDETVARRTLEAVIADSRVEAEGVLLAPLADDQPMQDRMKQHSAAADLVLLSMPQARPGETEGYFLRCNTMLRPWGACLFVRAARGVQDTRVVFKRRPRTVEREPEPRDRFALETPPVPRLAREIAQLERRLRESILRFQSDVAEASLNEERVYLAQIAEEIAAIARLDRRLRWRGARRFVVRGHLEGARSRLGESILRSTRTLTTAPEGGETPWRRRHREGLRALLADLDAAVLSLPVRISVPTEPAEWAPAPEDPPRFRVRKQLVRVGIALGLKPPDRSVPLRALGDFHLSASLTEGLEETFRALGIRRFEVLRRARRLVIDAEQLFAGLFAELDAGTEPLVETSAFRESLRREVAALAQQARASVERFAESGSRPSVLLEERIRSHANGLVADLSRPQVCYSHSWMRSSERERRAHHAAAARLEASPELWDLQQRALADALLLDVQVIGVSIEARRAAHQLYKRVRRDLEAGPISQLSSAEEIMRRALERLRSDPATEAPRRPSLGPPPLDRDRPIEPPPAEVEALREALSEAADDLRATWDQPYRPEGRELLEQLLAALGRAAERVPESVSTLGEADLDAVFEGRPERTLQVFRARRLAQSFLEEVVVEPARRALDDLPQVVEESQDELVDACRLVAFELEHALDESELQEGGPEVPTEAQLGDVLRERSERIKVARQRVERFLDELKAVLVDGVARALDGARQAITGEIPEHLRRDRGDVLAERADEAWSELRSRLAGAWRLVGQRRVKPTARRGLRGFEPALTDELLDLRERLMPNQEVQAALPLVYRRLFGRAPLETHDLAVGRDAELDAARRLITRWRAGAGGPIAIVGEPRSGRSTLASIVVREILAERTVIRVQPPPGGTASPEELNQVVAKAVGAREGRSAEGALRTMAPGAVFLVDDLGRWMERAPGGLEALELWLRLFNRIGDRHLFVATCSALAWTYAEPLVGLAERFLGTLVTPPVSAAELKELLLLRQGTSGLELILEDPSGRLGRGVWGGASRGFARIYQQTNGNVGEAIDLWRRSIVGVSEKGVVVRIGPEPDTRVLYRLPPRWYAALLSIALHRGLSVARMARVMRLSRDDALALLSDLERAGLLISDRSGVWALEPVLLPFVLRALRARGMIP